MDLFKLLLISFIYFVLCFREGIMKKKLHITIRIDEELIKKIDELIKGTSYTRSFFINKLLESILK